MKNIKKLVDIYNILGIYFLYGVLSWLIRIYCVYIDIYEFINLIIIIF